MLELDNLHKTLGNRTLLQGISLRVEAGQTVALLGASGSGKSTLLQIVAGLQPPSAGRVLWQGADITAMPPEQRRFALMFQDFALFPHLNVQDNVAFGLIEQGIPKTQAREQARAMLARFGLQQRVALARALITAPRVLLLDEPFSALDAKLREQLREEFKTRITQAGIATILVTHDEAEARAMAGHAWQLQDGQVIQLW